MRRVAGRLRQCKAAFTLRQRTRVDTRLSRSGHVHEPLLPERVSGIDTEHVVI